MVKQAKKISHRRESQGTNPLATILLLIVSTVILSYLAFFASAPADPPDSATPTPTPAECPNMATPIQTAEQAKAYLARVMASYSDMMYASVPTPEFNSCTGEWEVTVTMFRNNITQRAFLKITDDPVLLLSKAYMEGPKPPAISEDSVVTNGTIKIAGKIPCPEQSGCGNKTCVWLFADPYDRYSIAADENMEKFLSAHADSAEFTYRILQTQSGVLENSFGRDDVQRISNYFVCAQDQGLLTPLKSCAYEKYRSKGIDAPLSKEELDECLPEGLDLAKFESCVPTAYSRIALDRMVAETYLGLGNLATPRVVFGCQYKVHPTYLEHGFCFVNPEAAGCS